MRILLKCEYLKSRRRWLLPMAIALIGVELVWVMHGNLSEDNLSKGWMMYLYQMPLANTIFLPLLSIAVSSRICDLEHKGHMQKQLCCIASRGMLYSAKLIYGLGIIMACLLIQFTGLYIWGKLRGFGGEFPVKLYMLYWLATIAATAAIYIFQHTLSLFIKNQAIPFFIGIIGEFLGLFSMFLPQYPLLRNSLLWGYYGALQFVGGDWDRETRISTFYYMGVDWAAFALLTAAALFIYLIGRNLFSCKEV